MYTYTVYGWDYCFSDDDNRIALKPLADANDCQRDYINACYVDVSLFLCLMLSISIMHVHSPFHACRATLFQTSLLPLKVKISSSASYAICDRRVTLQYI